MTVQLAFSVKDAAAATSLSASSIERAIRAGQLRIKTTHLDDKGNPDGKRLILASELQRYLEGLPDA